MFPLKLCPKLSQSFVRFENIVMDQSCLRRSQLIKQMHVVVWGLLVVAGGVLASRVVGGSSADLPEDPAVASLDTDLVSSDSEAIQEADDDSGAAKILKLPKRRYANSENKVKEESVEKPKRNPPRVKTDEKRDVNSDRKVVQQSGSADSNLRGFSLYT